MSFVGQLIQQLIARFSQAMKTYASTKGARTKEINFYLKIKASAAQGQVQ